MRLTLRPFPSPEAMADAAAEILISALASALAARGSALLIATGGGTAPLIYQRLHTAPIDWSKVTVTLSDDRCVPEDHPASNARLLRETFLRGAAGQARFVGLTDRAAVDALAFPADAALLGMGGDLHIASIFPAGAGMAQAHEARARIVETTPDPLPANAPFARLTLSLPTLAASRLICVAFSGEDKRRALESAQDDAPIRSLAQRAGDRLQIVCSI